MSTEREAILVPLTRHDLDVLAWYAEWTPEIHRLNQKRRKAWPPGFREMDDASQAYGEKLDRMKADGSYPPAIGGETSKRSRARSLLERLLSYRMIEGSPWSPCRLTVRGRAALLFHGRPCPDLFESHCSEVFDDVSLVPRSGSGGVSVDFDDSVMGRVPDRIKSVAHGELLPDTKEVWGYMLEEYKEDNYRARGGLTGASACLSKVSTTGRWLNGSLRRHHNYVSIRINDGSRRGVAEIAVSYEGLADLLTSGHDVPVTIDSYQGHDGMRRGQPCPEPASVSRRMQERVKREEQDVRIKLSDLRGLVEGAKGLGKAAAAEMLKTIELLERDARTLGAFAAQQASEELSTAAESMGIMIADKMAMAGMGTGALLGTGSPAAMLLDAWGGAGEEND